VSSAEGRRLLRAALERSGARLDQIEARLASVERSAFAELDAIDQRLAALEERRWLPSGEALQRERYAAITELRAEGWSISAISKATRVSRSRVGDIVSELPVPERVISTNGRTYPARARRAV
jgi:hypothetical protein